MCEKNCANNCLLNVCCILFFFKHQRAMIEDKDLIPMLKIYRHGICAIFAAQINATFINCKIQQLPMYLNTQESS